MSSKILLIDDDVELVGMVKDYLENESYSVECAHDGESGMTVAESSIHDLIVLDLMMPKMSGIEFLKKFRETNFTPIIVLTGRGDDEDCVIGLELGADDYVSKPCKPRELLARIRAILRRTAKKTSQESDPILVGTFTLCPTRRRVDYLGHTLELTSSEFNLLEILLLNAGRIVTKSQLSEEGIGRPLTPFDRIVDVHISRIRQKLSKIPECRSTIKTVVRRGYQLIVE